MWVWSIPFGPLVYLRPLSLLWLNNVSNIITGFLQVVIGPATVGGIQAGAFKIGDTAGTIDNIIQCKLYRPGCVGFVSKSVCRHSWSSLFFLNQNSQLEFIDNHSLFLWKWSWKMTLALVKLQGGMSNELYNTIARVTDGIYEGS